MKWRSLEESTPGTDTRSLRDIYAERKELIARYVPAETQAVHARVIGELKAAGICGKSPSPAPKRHPSNLRITTAKPFRPLIF